MQSKPRSTTVTITRELKSQILAEILTGDAVIPQIAESYNLSPKRLYNWRNSYRKAQDSKLAKSSDNFVELKPIEALSLRSDSNLSQISLTLNDVSLSLEGSISTTSLIKILGALESC